MSDKAWKVAERKVAKAIGGRRLIFAGDYGDAESETVICDVKRRLAYSLNDARADLRALASRGDGTRLPMIVAMDRGHGHKNHHVVIVSLEDWVQWYGPILNAEGLIVEPPEPQSRGSINGPSSPSG